jgi:hypothetical protein
MSVTASELRQNVYRLLDRSLETGEPLEVRRKGQLLRIVPEPPAGGKLGALVPHDCVTGDPADLVHMDWSETWDATGGLL